MDRTAKGMSSGQESRQDPRLVLSAFSTLCSLQMWPVEVPAPAQWALDDELQVNAA